MENSAFILLLAGPSGAGKSSVLKPVVAEDPRVHFSVSCTTRERREGEVHGREYFFLDAAEFEAARDAGKFVEWAKVHDHFYGTREADLTAALDRGEIPLLEIDVQGGQQIMDRFGDRVVSVFLHPPSPKVLEERLRGRGSEDEASLQRRLANAKMEIAQSDVYAYQIVNDDLNAARDELRSIIDDECRRRAGGPNSGKN
jgi:guanylate kinase